MDTWFYPQGIVKILSLAIVNNHYPLAFDAIENFFTIHLQYRDIVFRQSEFGIY